MANRTVEANLRLSSKLGSMAAFRTLGANLAKVDKQSRRFNKNQSRFMVASRRMYGEMALLAGRYAGPAALAGGAYAIGRAASNMEDALVGIKKKTGATADQLQRIREEIKQVGEEVPVSLSEIAAAFERGGAAGIALENLKEFASLSTKVADAWDMSAEDVSNAFAGFNAGMGIPLDEMERFADLINVLADAGIADESGIVAFIDRVGGSLRNFGLTPEQIAAYASAFQNLKMPAEIAARAMDTLAGKLAAPENLSDRSFAALEKIVGDMEKFAEVIGKDPNQGLLFFFGQLEKLTGQQRISLLGALMGEGFDDEVARMVNGFEEIKRNLATLDDVDKVIGSIADSAAAKVSTFSSQTQILKNQLEGLADTIGAPALEALNDGLKSVNRSISKDKAINRGLESQGIEGVANQIWWRIKNGGSAFQPPNAAEREMMWRGGWRPDGWGSGLPPLNYPTGAPDISPVPIPTGRPEPTRRSSVGRVRGGRASPLALGMLLDTRDPRAATRPAIGASHRDAERTSMKALRSDPNGVADAIDAALSSGGDKAASKIAEGGQNAGERMGETANAKIMAGATAAGEAFGNAAAAKIRNAASAAANADVGRTGTGPGNL